MCCGKGETNEIGQAVKALPIDQRARFQDMSRTLKNAKAQENYVVVEYRDPQKRNYVHLITSPTGVVLKDGMRNYGTGKSGRKLRVHVDDVKATPKTFVRIVQKELPPVEEDDDEELIEQLNADLSKDQGVTEDVDEDESVSDPKPKTAQRIKRVKTRK